MSRQKRAKTMKGVRKKSADLKDILIEHFHEFAQWSDHCFEGLDKLGLNNPRWVNFLTNNYSTEVGGHYTFCSSAFFGFLSWANGYVNQLMFRKGSHHYPLKTQKSPRRDDREYSTLQPVNKNDVSYR